MLSARPISAINSISDPSAPDYKEQLKEALSVFRTVPEDECRYVNNYSSLASALELVGGESELDKDTPYITSISVTKNPDKLRYYEGDAFDPAGMIVTAVYSDGSSKEITEYKLSVKSQLELSTSTVYISYGILKTSVSIEVREKCPGAEKVRRKIHTSLKRQTILLILEAMCTQRT